MSGASSSAAGWSSRLEPARRVEDVFRRPDDPRLGEIIRPWTGNVADLTPGRAVLIGFPQDEGVRRNHGRPGAAEAPHEIRQKLFCLTPFDPSTDTDLTAPPPLDLGDVRIRGSLEESQQELGEIVAAVLERGAVPVVLGGGHETAFGHYLGYALSERPVAVVNLDAHLDVRPLLDGRGHSGSPFRQMMEHVPRPLPGEHYVCLGASPSAVARDHARFVTRNGGVIHWWKEDFPCRIEQIFHQELTRLASASGSILVTFDADAFTAADVPGVSAANPVGLSGGLGLVLARQAGRARAVSSFEIVEINPSLDRDGQSSRWAALVAWQFLCGVAQRARAISA